MQIEIANGILTTRHPASPDGEPVFIRDGVIHQPADSVGSGETAPAAGDLIADEYTRAADAGRRFSRLEYNVIARFAGLPSMNPCSGE